MHSRWLHVAVIAMLFGLLPAGPPVAAQTEERCFPATGVCISGRFRAFWEQNDGERTLGLPIGPVQTVAGIPTQWFQRHRLEHHATLAAPYDVLLGHLGRDRLAQLGRDPAALPPSDPRPDCRFFPATRHNVCGRFLTAWEASGLELDGQAGLTDAERLALFGLPLGEAAVEEVAGVQREVQWFERARFERHALDPPFDVQFGLLGSELQTAPATPSEPPPLPPAPAPAPAVSPSPYDGVWTIISSHLDQTTIVVDNGSVRRIDGKVRVPCRFSFASTFPHEEGLIRDGVFFVRSAPGTMPLAMTGTFSAPKVVAGTAVMTACGRKIEYGWEGRKIAELDRPVASNLDGMWKGSTARGETVTFIVKDSMVVSFEVMWRRQDECVMTLTTPFPIVNRTVTIRATHEVGTVAMFGTFRTDSQLAGEGNFAATSDECSNPGHRFFEWNAGKAIE